MLSRGTLRVNEIIFRLATIIHVVPYKWSYRRQELRLTKSKVRYLIWRLVFGIQFTHFGYLCIRFLNSIQQELRPSFILFQAVWNVLFFISVCGQICTIHSTREIPRVINHWLKIEALENSPSENTVIKYFSIFAPVALIQLMGHGFMYARNPFLPQYLISFFLDTGIIDLSTTKIHFVSLFGCFELMLATYIWSICFFYVTTMIGCACTIRSRTLQIKGMTDKIKATQLYYQLYRFANEFEDTYLIAILSLKACIFLCAVIALYNTLMFNLPPLPYMLMPLTVVACIICYVYALIPLCQLNTISMTCLKKWKAKTRRETECSDWKSFRPLRIRIGFIYTLKRSTVLMFFDFIVMNVINILLFYPPD